MRRIGVVLAVSAQVLGVATVGSAADTQVAQAGGAAAKPAMGEVDALKIRATIVAIDRDKQTVTLKRPRGRTLELRVEDAAKLDAVKVGDPVVATYVEGVAIRVKRPGSATPGVLIQGGRATSKPGETPAGAVGRQTIISGTLIAVDAKRQVVTLKGPWGSIRKVKVGDPKSLEAVKVGDLVELTLTQALAIALDKPSQ